MKYLEVPSLSYFSSCLTGLDGGDIVIFTRVEAFTCKRAGSDKKLYKSLNKQYEELSKSPEFHEELSTSPFGPLSLSTSRRTFISLISTLNASFHDYDFSCVKPEQFRKEQNLHMVINSINNTLAPFIPETQNLLVKLWTTLEEEIKVSECDVYSYIPDPDADPFSEEGNIWCFNYFFFNKKLRRVVFLTCRAVSKIAAANGAGMARAEEEDDESEWQWSMEDQISEVRYAKSIVYSLD